MTRFSLEMTWKKTLGDIVHVFIEVLRSYIAQISEARALWALGNSPWSTALREILLQQHIRDNNYLVTSCHAATNFSLTKWYAKPGGKLARLNLA